MIIIRNFSEANTALEPYAAATPVAREAYTLGRMKKLLAALDNPQDKLKIIHVAGTSGKTSTCYYIAAMLTQAGRKVGLTVSPHVDEINERLQLDLLPLTETEYCHVLTEFLELITPLPVQPTYFELLVAMAFWYFERERVDYAVIEVGLGGLLDSTNVGSPVDKIAIITDIGLDHERILGTTLAEITAQKAGIIKSGDVVFCYQQAEEVSGVIRDRSGRARAELYEITYDPIATAVSSLPRFQQRNWQLAAQVYDYVVERDGLKRLTSEQLKFTQATYIPGRMEIITYKGKIIVLDGAHNPQKMTALTTSLRYIYTNQPIAALVAFKAGKDVRKTLNVVELTAVHVIATQFSETHGMQHTAATTETIVAAAASEKVESIPRLSEAFRALLSRPEPVLLVTGSFHLIQKVRILINSP